LDIEEFRGIRKTAEPLKFTKFNVLIGRNNTGKTSILEALYLLANPWSDYLAPLIGRGRPNFIADLHGGKKSLVYGYTGRCKLTYKVLELTVTMELDQNWVTEVKVNGTRKNSYKEYSEELARCLRVDVEYVHNLTFYIPGSSSFLKTLWGSLMNVWDSIVKMGIHKRIVKELIVPTVYDRFTEILIERGSLKLRKEVDEELGSLYIDIADIGDGIKRIITAVLALEYVKPKLVLWDDIEIAAHPGLLEAVLS